jgi:hypothetical protein
VLIEIRAITLALADVLDPEWERCSEVVERRQTFPHESRTSLSW